MNVNRQSPFGSDPSKFKDDVLTTRAARFIEDQAASGVPFFASVAYTAPHAGDASEPCPGAAKPAPRYVGAFPDATLPDNPALNEADTSDKHEEVRLLPLIHPTGIQDLEDRLYRCNLASLLHVDDGVSRLVSQLEASGVLDDTLIIYTSDNGFFYGEHRIFGGKIRAYDEALRVPLLIRGPGVPEGATIESVTTNADLASTILAATAATAGLPQDGKSLFDVIADPAGPVKS